MLAKQKLYYLDQNPSLALLNTLTLEQADSVLKKLRKSNIFGLS